MNRILPFCNGESFYKFAHIYQQYHLFGDFFEAYLSIFVLDDVRSLTNFLKTLNPHCKQTKYLLDSFPIAELSVVFSARNILLFYLKNNGGDIGFADLFYEELYPILEGTKHTLTLIDRHGANSKDAKRLIQEHIISQLPNHSILEIFNDLYEYKAIADLYCKKNDRASKEESFVYFLADQLPVLKSVMDLRVSVTERGCNIEFSPPEPTTVSEITPTIIPRERTYKELGDIPWVKGKPKFLRYTWLNPEHHLWESCDLREFLIRRGIINDDFDIEWSKSRVLSGGPLKIKALYEEVIANIERACQDIRANFIEDHNLNLRTTIDTVYSPDDSVREALDSEFFTPQWVGEDPPFIEAGSLLYYIKNGYRTNREYLLKKKDVEGTVYQFGDSTVIPLFTNSPVELTMYYDVRFDYCTDERLRRLNAYFRYYWGKDSPATIFQETGISSPIAQFEANLRAPSLPLEFWIHLRKEGYLIPNQSNGSIAIGPFHFPKISCIKHLAALFGDVPFSFFSEKELSKISSLLRAMKLNNTINELLFNRMKIQTDPLTKKFIIETLKGGVQAEFSFRNESKYKRMGCVYNLLWMIQNGMKVKLSKKIPGSLHRISSGTNPLQISLRDLQSVLSEAQ